MWLLLNASPQQPPARRPLASLTHSTGLTGRNGAERDDLSRECAAERQPAPAATLLPRYASSRMSRISLHGRAQQVISATDHVGWALLCNGIVILQFCERSAIMATATRSARRTSTNGSASNKKPEKTFRVGNCYATVWCNEVRGEGEQAPRIMRSVHLERRFWNEKLNNGEGDFDSSSSYSLGDIHNAVAVMQLAAEHLRQTEADVTRE
jgi:hypothetical protein